MTAENVLDAQSADEECRDCGYEPELKRTLGSFQVFAISFAFISVAVGIFGTYDDVLRDAGPVGIWLWIIVAVGQTLVALVVAQFAARIALSGSSYQWASRLANPKIGWLFGWLTFWYLAIAVVAMDNALASQALMPLVRHGAEREHRAADHVGGVAHSGRAGDRFYPPARHDHVQRSRDRTRDRGGFGDRPWGRHAVHRQRHPRQPHLAGDHRRRPQLLRHRRRVDGRDDHGPHHAGRLRLRGEPGRGGQGSVPQRPARDRRVGGGGGGAGPSVPRSRSPSPSRTSRGSAPAVRRSPRSSATSSVR